MVAFRGLASVEDAAPVGLHGRVGIDPYRDGAVVYDGLLDAADRGDPGPIAHVRPGVNHIGMVVRAVAGPGCRGVRQVGFQHGTGITAGVGLPLVVLVGEPAAAAVPVVTVAVQQPLLGQIDDIAVFELDVALQGPDRGKRPAASAATLIAHRGQPLVAPVKRRRQIAGRRARIEPGPHPPLVGLDQSAQFVQAAFGGGTAADGESPAFDLALGSQGLKISPRKLTPGCGRRKRQNQQNTKQHRRYYARLGPSGGRRSHPVTSSSETRCQTRARQNEPAPRPSPSEGRGG